MLRESASVLLNGRQSAIDVIRFGSGPISTTKVCSVIGTGVNCRDMDTLPPIATVAIINVICIALMHIALLDLLQLLELQPKWLTF